MDFVYDMYVKTALFIMMKIFCSVASIVMLGDNEFSGFYTIGYVPDNMAPHAHIQLFPPFPLD